jgi:dTMP kinase
MFLSLDGIDGTGKSTQLRLLAETLRGRGLTVTTCVDPGGTDLGAKLREILLHGRQTTMSVRTECLLFMASRAELIQQVITPALDRGEIVLSDRYLLANVVYQGHAGGLLPEEVWSLGQFATSGLFPDLTIVLDLPVDIAKSRRAGKADRMESRDNAYFERVRQGFLIEAARDPTRYQVVDATPNVNRVQTAIAEVVERHLRDCNLLPG